jgi:hypothetical protein
VTMRRSVTATLAIGSEETIRYILNKRCKEKLYQSQPMNRQNQVRWLLEQGSRGGLGRGRVGRWRLGGEQRMSAKRVREGTTMRLNYIIIIPYDSSENIKFDSD